MSDWTDDVLGFWFALPPAEWWRSNAAFDDQIRDRFEALWKEKRELPPETFLTDAKTAVAAVILFDQFPRNMFRGSAEAFATDPLAEAITREAVDQGLDRELPDNERLFLYMPMMHSENLDDQRRSLLLFTALGDADQLKYAQKHHDIIERFGRFPHRNAVLDRAPREAEMEAGDVVPW